MLIEKQIEVIRQVLALTDYSRSLNFDKSPSEGQFVVTGPQMGGDLERRIGFCVQIRKNRGQFGSDMVFIRHPSGVLVTHENQAYFSMTEVQERLARSLFESLPEDEEYSLGYSCCEKVHEVGFLVEESASRPSPVVSTTMVIDEVGADGLSKKTCVAFIG